MIYNYLLHKILEISGLSYKDKVNLVGQFLSYDFNDSIDPRLLDRGFTKEQLDQLKERVAMNAPRLVESCGLRFEGDLSRFTYNHFDYVIEMYQSYDKHGVLPFQGAHSDQPAQILEIFQIISQLMHEKNQRNMKEIERQNKKVK